MDNLRIAVIGLGYVGLPLARLFAVKYPVIGYDINESRVDELRNGADSTLEVEPALLESVLVHKQAQLETGNGLYCTSVLEEIRNCNI